MKTRRTLAGFLFLVATLFRGTGSVVAFELPLRIEEARVIREICETEEFEIQPANMPGWTQSKLSKSLQAYGVDPATLQTTAISVKEKPSLVLGMAYNTAGQVLALSGNGPWLRNKSVRLLQKMTELRIIRMDHNGYTGRDPRQAEFDGSGFEALADSKLKELKIGLSFSDRGMKHCAKIKGLKSLTVAHSQVTDLGLAYFAGHQELTELSIAEMASGRVTEKGLQTIANIPHLTRLGFKECYVTYEGGFAMLAPLKGQLVEIDLSSSIVSSMDLVRLQADHPEAKIVVLSAAEIVKRHKFVATNLAKQLPPELAAPLNEALGK